MALSKCQHVRGQMDTPTNKYENAGRRRDEVDFVHKLLQPALRPRLEELITRGTTSGPLIVEFDPTTTCNFACPECISMGLLNKGQFHPTRVIDIIDEFYRAGVKGIVFIGGGEPLAHSSMPQPIVHSHRLGMAVGLTTNGSLVDRYLDEIAECVKWTRFSVDAGTAETFAVFRPSHIKNPFDKVISNIERLVKRKKGKVGYSFLLLERKTKDRTLTNHDEIYQAAR
jgi:molybdenum cofactor biosynthesis enzyme MoaA